MQDYRLRTTRWSQRKSVVRHWPLRPPELVKAEAQLAFRRSVKPEILLADRIYKSMLSVYYYLLSIDDEQQRF